VSALSWLSLEARAELEQLVAELVEAEFARREALRADEWPEWMSVDTAARYLDCSPERVRKLIARRTLPFCQDAPGARVFLRRSDLDAHMSSIRHLPRGDDRRLRAR
jgi:excisionase family DNA binding protein